MKLYLEGNQPHIIVESGLSLAPGVNDVPDDLAKTLLQGAEAEATRSKQPPKIRPVTASDDKPKSTGTKAASTKSAKPKDKASSSVKSSKKD